MHRLKSFLPLLTTLVCVLYSPTFASAIAAPLPPAPEGRVSIVVIPDTQGYKGSATKYQPKSTAPLSNPVFDAHTRWISENLKSQRVAFVSQVGDIVDKNNDAQWTVARQNMDRLHGKVPYGISVGNHDMTGKGDSSLFQKYFGTERFKDMPWYGGFFEGDLERPSHSGNGSNSYQLFTAEGVDFVAIHLECNAPNNVLDWAHNVLEAHKDRWAFVTTHMYLGPLNKPKSNAGYIEDPKGVMTWTKCHRERGNSAQQMWDYLFRKHKNLHMIISGDQSRTSALYLKQVGAEGNTVHALLSDYTSSGPLRIYRFHPSKGEISVITYDTTKKSLITDSKHVSGRENHQFTIAVDFTRDGN